MKFCYMGLFDSNGSWIHPARTEKTYELIYAIDGTISMEEDGRPIVLSPGELYILRPGLLHRGTAVSPGHTAFYWVHFLTVDGDFPLPSFARLEHGAPLLKELMHHSLRPERPAYLLDAILSHFLALTAENDAPQASAIVSNVLAYIRAHISGTLTAEEVARHFSYHPDHLSRLIKRRSGLGLKAWIDSLLLNSAKELLSTSTCSVKEIAQKLGFNDEHSFLHFFRYHESISPTAFRRHYPFVYINSQ